ncbi:hypothetical protein [Shigella dysenteriae]|uniref:hypothetical protein n=1 Tax=Shigella dysenteriae TaxID=622 RepID=UPI001493BD2F|nr:hypothetical protein [Shigella dysenteriae]
MNVNAGHERTSKARIIHQIQLIRGITCATFARYLFLTYFAFEYWSGSHTCFM